MTTSIARRSWIAACAVAALIVGLFVCAAPTTTASAAAAGSATSTSVVQDIVRTADLSAFQPGNIISDAVFFNAGTMSATQIQDFLNGRVSTCSSGATCLKDYRQATTTRPADAYCRNTYEGATNESAASIIAKVAAACGINPQVLLVTLQKEQGLVTATAPSESRYRIAMGYACPDTAACDTRYYGFQNQVYSAARQFNVYRQSSYFSWYAPGGNRNIGFHPNAACGSSPVYVANDATAGLYYYTPYQPNAAALRAGYGTGDSCSSYGNRNFYNYFTDWFGSTQGETMQVLQVSGTTERHLVSEGNRWKFATDEAAAQFTWISAVRNVPRSELANYEDRGIAPRAIKTTSGIVYLLDSGTRLRARDVWQVADFGWDYGRLPVASDAQAARYPDAGWLERVVRADGRAWLIQGGTRREVLDLGLLPRYGIPALASAVSPVALSAYGVGVPVIAVGVYRDATNPYRIQTDAGTFRVPDAASGTAIARSARELSVESFAQMPAASTMPLRMASAGRSYVMVDDGWLEVTASDYPAVLDFTPLPAGAAAGLPVSGRVAGPHFVRERSSPQTYLISWGTIQAVTPAEQAWVTAVYGVPSRVWVALDGVIGDATTTEGLVRTSDGAAYLLDGARAYRMRDCTQVEAWGGNCASLPTITAAKLGAYAAAGTLEHLVRSPAGTIWLPQGGQMRQVLDPSILARYGIPQATSAVSTATVGRLPVGEPALAAGVYSDGGSGRLVVTDNGDYTLTKEQAVGAVGGSARALTAGSFAKVTVDGALPSRLRSDNRSFILTRSGWLEVSAAAYGGDGLFTQLPTRAWTGIVSAGSEQRPHFVKDDASGDEYLVSGGAIQPVGGPDERRAITSAFGVPPTVWTVVAGVLSGVKVMHDLVVKDAAGSAYLVDGATRYRLSSCAAAADLGRACASLRTLTAVQLSGLRDGGALAPLLRSTAGFLWLPQEGERREVPNPVVLAPYGIGSTSTTVSDGVLGQLRLAAPVVGVGVFDDRAGDVRIVTGDGQTFAVPPGARVAAVMAGAWPMTSASVDLLTVQGDLPTRILTGGSARVLTTAGWLTVSSADYGSLRFTAVGPRGAEGVLDAGTETGPHFVREQSSAQVMLASGGLSPVADEATKAWISSTYGVPSKVWVVADGALR